jgi:hypothetical protein
MVGIYTSFSLMENAIREIEGRWGAIVERQGDAALNISLGEALYYIPSF